MSDLDTTHDAIEASTHLSWTTGAVDFDILIDASAGAAAQPAIAFLGAVFGVRRANRRPHIVFRLRDYASLDERLFSEATTAFALRRSSARPFNLDLLKGRAPDGRTVAVDPATRTAYVVDPDAGRLTLFIGADSTFHVIETLRYTLLVAEQGLGTLILHASAAQAADGTLVLVLGDKGRGKTTTLLKLVLEQHLSFFSGDKVLADMTMGRLMLRAWPDYAHVGLGTLSTFPDFAAACGVSLTKSDGRPRDPNEKVLVPPARYRAALGANGQTTSSRVSHVIFPDIDAPDGPPSPITSAKERSACLGSIVEDARTFTPGCWHMLIDCPEPASLNDIFLALNRARWSYVPGRAAKLADCLAGKPA
jgi:hypothetical protein